MSIQNVGLVHKFKYPLPKNLYDRCIDSTSDLNLLLFSAGPYLHSRDGEAAVKALKKAIRIITYFSSVEYNESDGEILNLIPKAPTSIENCFWCDNTGFINGEFCHQCNRQEEDNKEA